MFCYERSGKSEQIQNMISVFLAGAAGNFFRVSSLCFMLVVLSPKLPRNFSKIELLHTVKSQKWGKQPSLILLNNPLSVEFF